jgi:phosphatidylglycerol---prolipoprotein diacylglyceryl transferase
VYPYLVDFGLIRVPTYVVCLFVAVLVTAWVSGREARRLGLPPARFYDMAFYMTVAALAGAYLLFVAFHYRVYLADPWRVFDVFQAGLVYYGGLLGALAVALIYPRRHGFSWRTGMDALALGLPLGLAVGRLGCFSAGCCFGRPADLPWAVRFPAGQGVLTAPLHPTQLYEAGLMVLIFGLLYTLRRRTRFAGELMLIYLLLAGWERFGVEFFRSPLDYRGPVWWGMPLTQIFALVLALTCGALWFWGRRSPQERTDRSRS